LKDCRPNSSNGGKAGSIRNTIESRQLLDCTCTLWRSWFMEPFQVVPEPGPNQPHGCKGYKHYIIPVSTMQPILSDISGGKQKVASCFLSKQGKPALAGMELVYAALCSQLPNYIQPQSSSSISSTALIALPPKCRISLVF
jgi:hypothetical protein